VAKKKAKKSKSATSKPLAAKSKPKKYRAAFYSAPKALDPVFVDKVHILEKKLKKRVVLLWHGNADDKFSFLDELNYFAFAHNIHKLKEQEKVALLVFSPGGMAGPAFKLASLLRKHCGGFIGIVPYYAKSAATLFLLGADKIIMSKHAELGPLDAQIEDIDKEKRISALEVVQAIQRLNSEAIRAVDQQMLHWLGRTRKKVDKLLPIATHFVSEMMQPLFDKIDTVYFTGVARNLKIAQDYAQRLLETRGLSKDKAGTIADILTNAYSEHGYVIDSNELKRIGIDNTEEATGDVADIIEEMAFMLTKRVMLGPLEEI
jgi:hypothetical protein